MNNLLIITWIVGTVILPCKLFASQAERLEQELAVNIAEQLQDIEEHFVKARDRVEKFYAKEQQELTFRAEKKIKQVEETERAKLAKTEEIKKNQYYQTHGVFPDAGLLLQEEIALAEKRIAQAKDGILTKLEQDIQLLEKQRSYRLKNQLPYQEARLKKELLFPEPEPPVGTVTGIVYGKDKQFALINHQVMKPGDVLQGVTITKIYQNVVDFEKNGAVWQQRPGQSPACFWN